MKNIHLLPTDKPSRLGFGGKELILVNNVGNYKNAQHIYITSDEEIKIGDWYLNGVIPTNERINKSRGTNSASFYKSKDVKKIILTTDQDLIKDGVQAIDDEFLEWFVKNSSCEEVGVIKEMYVPQSNGKISDGRISHEISLDPSENTLPFYKIIIPQEEPKQAYYEEQKELRRKLLNLIDNLEKDELLRLSKEEANQETLENKLELLISEWNKRQLQYTDLASQNIDCSHTTKKFTYKAMATRDCWKELLTLLNNHKDEQTRNT